MLIAQVLCLAWTRPADAHSGDVVAVPLLAAPPRFDPTGHLGCDATGPDGYRSASVVRIDNNVIVYVARTDSTLYLCIAGIETNDGSKGFDHNDAAWFFVDVDHTGGPAGPRHFLFKISPTSLTTATSFSARGPQYSDPGPPQDSGPPAHRTDWRAAGAAGQVGEFSSSWNAELQLSKELLGGNWRPIGIRLVYNVGIPFVTNQLGIWPPSSSPFASDGWGDLSFARTGKPHGVFTNNNDNARTGSYVESALNPTALAARTFGKLHTWTVDGQVYAQPLFISGAVTSDGTAHDIVLVATAKNFVHAFDANDFSELWRVSLGTPVASSTLTSLPGSEGTCSDLFPWFGVTSTPVIDPERQRIYIVSLNNDGGGIFARLHMLSLQDGREMSPGPINIEGSVPGKGWGSENGVVTFDPRIQLNRPGLLLANGRVYVAFGGHCDQFKYHGWVFAYDATTLRQAAIFNTTPDGSRAGIWQAGRGLAADQFGDIFLMTGNAGHYPAGCGDADLTSDQQGFGNSFVQLDGLLRPKGWFIPPDNDNQRYHDVTCLNGYDLDLGSSGPLLLVSPSGRASDNRLIGGGKEGIFFLFNFQTHPLIPNTMHPTEAVVGSEWVQWHGITCHACPYGTLSDPQNTHHIHSGPVFLANAGSLGQLIYAWAENGTLKAFQVTQSHIVVPPIATSMVKPPIGMPGGSLSVSHTEDPKAAIVWASMPLKGDANHGIVTGQLVALMALPDSTGKLPILWQSETFPGDSVGLYSKFSPPTIADGKIFLASFGVDTNNRQGETGAVHVYGLAAHPPPRGCSGRPGCTVGQPGESDLLAVELLFFLVLMRARRRRPCPLEQPTRGRRAGRRRRRVSPVDIGHSRPTSDSASPLERPPASLRRTVRDWRDPRP